MKKRSEARGDANTARWWL